MSHHPNEVHTGKWHVKMHWKDDCVRCHRVINYHGRPRFDNEGAAAMQEKCTMPISGIENDSELISNLLRILSFDSIALNGRLPALFGG
jgi:hypothetical protein